MNISLSALRIFQDFGPVYYTNSLKTQKNIISFNNIRGARMFNSFYQSYVPNTHFKLTRSQFSNCLDQVIHIDSNKYEAQTLYSRISLKESDPLTISDNLFYKISTLSKEGGALEVKSTNTFRFYHNGFYFCSSDTKNGAISVQCSSMIADGNCFESCKSGTTGIAGKISVVGKSNTLNINETSIHLCSPNVLSGQGNAFQVLMGEQTINNYNATNNFVSSQSAGIWSSAGTLLSVKYMNIEGCDSTEMTSFSGVAGYDGNAQFINFVNNNFRAGSAIFTTSFRIIMRNVVFRNNTVSNKTILLKAELLSHIVIQEVHSDLAIDKMPNADPRFGGKVNITNLKIINFPRTEELVHFATALCWARDVEDSPGGLKGFVIRWERTLLLAGSTLGLAILALVGKRLWQNRRSKRRTTGPQDTERLKNETSYNYEYDFDVL